MAISEIHLNYLLLGSTSWSQLPTPCLSSQIIVLACLMEHEHNISQSIRTTTETAGLNKIVKLGCRVLLTTLLFILCESSDLMRWSQLGIWTIWKVNKQTFSYGMETTAACKANYSIIQKMCWSFSCVHGIKDIEAWIVKRFVLEMVSQLSLEK